MSAPAWCLNSPKAEARSCAANTRSSAPSSGSSAAFHHDERRGATPAGSDLAQRPGRGRARAGHRRRRLDALAAAGPPPMTTLLSDADLADLGPPEAVRLPLDLVDPNPRNPRAALAEVDALADNIRSLGLLQPVIVR